MNQQGHAARAPRIAGAVLFGAYSAERDRGNEFQMARVEAQREMEGAAVRGRKIAAVAQMIFYVAAVLDIPRVDEFAKHFTVFFSDHVDQHVEPAAMGHGENDLTAAVAGVFFDRKFNQGDEALRAFQGKTLGADELAANEFVKGRRLDQIAEELSPLFPTEIDAFFFGLDSLLEPCALRARLDMRELDADAGRNKRGAAVRRSRAA